MQNLEQERARFEAWATKRGMSIIEHNDRYWSHDTHIAWQAWQARCPDGYSVVPNEATEEMTDNVMWATHDKTAQCVWIDMLAAAPQPGEES